MSEPSENALDDIMVRLSLHPIWGEGWDGKTWTTWKVYRPKDGWVTQLPPDPSAINAARQSALNGLEAVGHTAGAPTPPFLKQRSKNRTRSECHPFPDYR